MEIPSTPISTGSKHPDADVAIVGMACLFPGAADLPAFWQNVVDGVDCISDPPDDWIARQFLDPQASSNDRVYTARGGYLGDLCRFDPTRFGVMPSSVDGAEPDQFLALSCAHAALEDAGVPDLPLDRERTAVILGRGLYINRGLLAWVGHGFVVDQVISLLGQLGIEADPELLERVRSELKGNLPPFNAETIPGLINSIMCGRIANRLDLHGPAYAVDAACASALIALEQGVEALRSGRSNAAIVGGVQGSSPGLIHLLFSNLGATSRSGRIAPFSAEADGVLLGEGCGMLVLKRRADAERDGHRIYALVKGVGVSSDGRAEGILAPRQEGQVLAIERAFAESRVERPTIGLIEAHGTATLRGDATEVQSLAECFPLASCGRASIALGSVKSMIGHLLPAAASASLIKTALALYERTLPPTLHAEKPNPALGLGESPFYLCGEARPWIHGDLEQPRRAGVNAFGFGGINAHAILEEHCVDDESALASVERRWPVELVVVSAPDRGTLANEIRALASWLDSAGDDVTLLDVAAACARRAGACRLALVAASVEDLAEKLATSLELLSDPERERIQSRKGIYWYAEPLAAQGRLAFVFPGEGAQYPGMMGDLCRQFPDVRRELDLTDVAFRRSSAGRPLSRLLFPPPGEGDQAEAQLLRLSGAVGSVIAADRALLNLVGRLGIRADDMVGHSSGEFVALLAAGAYEVADTEALVESVRLGADTATRIASEGLVPPASLLSVGGIDPGVVRSCLEAVGGDVVMAMDNCPNQVVLSGPEERIDRALELLRGKGGLCEKLPWGRAYHTEAFAPACRLIEEYFSAVGLGAPRSRLWSCATAARFPGDAAEARELAVRQWRSRVRFRETIEAMYEDGVRVFLELGPRGNLSAFVSDTLARRPHAAVPLQARRKGGIEQLCHALGSLAAHGVSVDLERLTERRRPQPVDLDAAPAPPARREPELPHGLSELRISEELAASLAEARRGPQPAEPERAPSAEPERAPSGEPAVEPRVASSVATPSVRSAHGIPARQRLMAEFQQTMRAFLETQDRVIQARSSAHSPSAAPTAARPAPEPREQLAAAPVRVPDLPFIEHRLEFRPFEHLVAECEVGVEAHRYLLDHTFFGRGLSVRHPEQRGLPVMPLAMSLEVMAEAALALCPGRRIAALRDIQTSGWLFFETRSRRLRVSASTDDAVAVRVRLTEGDREGMSATIAEAVVELTDGEVALGSPSVPDRAEGPGLWRPEEIYGSTLFHGPAFQGIRDVESCGERGVRARVREPASSLLFAPEDPQELALPVALIDVAGHVPGMAIIGRCEPEHPVVNLIFPNRYERIEFAQRRPRDVDLVAVSTLRREQDQVHSDVEMTDPDGRVVLRVLGRTDERVTLPNGLYQYWMRPKAITMSREIGGLFRCVPGIEDCRLFESGEVGDVLLVKRLWSGALAHMILGSEEFEAFTERKLFPVAGASWLLRAAVAKDAVRAQADFELCMADVEIAADGTALARGAGGESLTLEVAAAESGFRAIALAARPGRFRGIACDLETPRPLDADAWSRWFTRAERELVEAALGRSGESSEVGWASAIAAKRALGRALVGVGGAGPGAEEIALTGLEMEPERLRIGWRRAGAPAAESSGETLVHRRMYRERILTLCLLEVHGTERNRGQNP